MNFTFMKKILTCLYLSFSAIGLCQNDTSDVFIVGDSPSEVSEDSILVKRLDFNNALKFDVARIYSAVYMMSFEHLIDDNRWSLEYEGSFDLETDRFWYDIYTDYKFSDVENNSSLYSGEFRSSYMFFAGIGITLKHYLSKKKSGIYGLYLGLKLKDRYGQIDVYNKSAPNNPIPKTSFTGTLNLFEITPTLGYSFCLWDFVIVDPFIGPSAIVSSLKYGSFENENNGAYWQEHKRTKLFPALHFGFRIGVSVDNVYQLFQL